MNKFKNISWQLPVFAFFLSHIGAISFAMEVGQAAREIVPYEYGKQAIPDGQTPNERGYRAVNQAAPYIVVCPFQKVIFVDDAGHYIFGMVGAVSEDNTSADVFCWDELTRCTKRQQCSREQLFVDPFWLGAPDEYSFVTVCPPQGFFYLDMDVDLEGLQALVAQARTVFDGDGFSLGARYMSQVCERFQDVCLTQIEQGRWFGWVNPFSTHKGRAYPALSTGDGFLVRSKFECRNMCVQKKRLNPEDEYACLSDIHGDMDALMAFLAQLKERGVLADDFSLKPNFYVTFLGDMVDRGPQGVQVLYTIFRLKIKNPNQVIILRGNHECGFMNEQEQFSLQLQEMGMSELGPRYRFYALYNLMPAALYLTYEVDGGQRHGLLCHGGPEIGFDSRNFLDSDADFSTVTLDRPSGFAKLFPKSVLEKIKAKRTEHWEKQVEHVPVEDFCLFPWQEPVLVGFLWGDFIDEVSNHNELVFDTLGGWSFGSVLCFNPARGFSFGVESVRILCGPQIDFILRGHQHGLWIDKLKDDHGFYVFAKKPLIGTVLSSGTVDPDEKKLFESSWAELFWHDGKPMIKHWYQNADCQQPQYIEYAI